MQKMLYDYASYIIPYYADDLYAVTSSPNLGNGWQNWGDWRANPGLAVDSSLPNLWFHIYPEDNPSPVISAFSPIEYVAGSPVRISVVASDPKGEPLTFTWDFGDGSPPQTSATNSIEHTYAVPGNYTIKVRVQDSEWPVCSTTTARISPSGINLPPVATLDYQFPAAGHGWVNESLTFVVTARDPEGDPLYITWDFGDGVTATNFTTDTQTDKTIVQSHTYTSPGNYTLTVAVTDNGTGAGHVQTRISTIPIWPRPAGPGPSPPPAPEANPWINYGVPIGIAAAVVLSIVAVILRRRRIRKEELREEERPEQGPPPPPPST